MMREASFGRTYLGVRGAPVAHETHENVAIRQGFHWHHGVRPRGDRVSRL